jgi:hypothetical protein
MHKYGTSLNAFEKVDLVNENKVLISHCKIELWIANIARSCNQCIFIGILKFSKAKRFSTVW